MIDERYVGEMGTIVKTVNVGKVAPLYIRGKQEGVEPLPEAYKGQLDEVMKTVRMG